MNRTPQQRITAIITQAINSDYAKLKFSLVFSIVLSIVFSIVFSIGVILFNYTKYSLVLVAPARVRAYAHARGGAL